MNKSQQTLTARVSVLEADVAEMKAGIKQLLALHMGQQVAEVPAVTVQTVQGEVVTSTDEPTGPSFRDLRNALKAHKAAGAIKPGLTVKEAIAEGLMLADGSLPNGTPAPVVAAPAQVVQVAQVTADEPARKVDDRPRRANGTITPKGEWVIRRALMAQGLTPEQVDKKTKKAMKALASA